ncbi:MAG TPA: VWA domain-containing protein, partial [Chthoniobacteraceae bacterium]
MPLLNPVFLVAVAAVGIPLWLHLSRRRKYRELEVGTLRFLRQAMRERRKRWRFEEIPLLLLRVAAIALIAFIFARPYFPRPRSVEKGSETLILLDGSGSITPEMAKAARSAANRAIARAGGKRISLAQFSDEVEPLASLDRYQPIAGAPKRIDTALGWALDHFLQEGAAGKVVLAAHLAANSLPTLPPRVWPPQISVEIMPLEPPTVDNGAVRKVTLLTPYVSKEMEIEARVWLPPSRTSDEDRTVTLDAEGVHQTVLVPPGSERAVFHFEPPRPAVQGVVSIRGGDPWPSDDRRPFSVRWAEPARVLLVDGRPGATPFEGQAYFIEKALSASGAAHGKSPFKPEIVFSLEGSRNGLVDLAGVRAIALCGVTDLTPDSARALTEFVRQGGGLISVLNEQWTPETTALLVDAGLFPEAVAFSNDNDKRPLETWDHDHPALREFDGRDGGDLRQFEWRDAFAIQPAKGWRTLAALDGGHPLLLEKESAGEGAGRVFILAHPLNRNWTDIPREPLFVPFVKNLFGALGKVAQAAPEIPVYSPGARRRQAVGTYSESGDAYVIAPDSDVALVATASEDAFRNAFGLPTANAAPPAALPITHGEGAER